MNPKKNKDTKKGVSDSSLERKANERDTAAEARVWVRRAPCPPGPGTRCASRTTSTQRSHPCDGTGDPARNGGSRPERGHPKGLSGGVSCLRAFLLRWRRRGLQTTAAGFTITGRQITRQICLKKKTERAHKKSTTSKTGITVNHHHQPSPSTDFSTVDAELFGG